MKESEKMLECILLSCQKQFFLLPLISLVEIVKYPHSTIFSSQHVMSNFMWRGINLPLVNFMLMPLACEAHPKVAIVRTLFKSSSSLYYIAVLCGEKPKKMIIEEKDIAWENEEEKESRLKGKYVVRLLDLQAFSAAVEKRLGEIR